MVGIAIGGRHGSVAAQDLDPLIVAVRGLAAVVDGPDYTFAEAQRDYRPVQIADLTDFGIHQDRCRRIDFFYFVSNQKSRHIEIVDGHIQKDSTRHLYI